MNRESSTSGGHRGGEGLTSADASDRWMLFRSQISCSLCRSCDNVS